MQEKFEGMHGGHELSNGVVAISSVSMTGSVAASTSKGEAVETTSPAGVAEGSVGWVSVSGPSNASDITASATGRISERVAVVTTTPGCARTKSSSP